MSAQIPPPDTAALKTNTEFPLDEQDNVRFPYVDLEDLSPTAGRTVLLDWYKKLWVQSSRRGPVCYTKILESPQLFYNPVDLPFGKQIQNPAEMSRGAIGDLISHFVDNFGAAPLAAASGTTTPTAIVASDPGCKNGEGDGSSDNESEGEHEGGGRTYTSNNNKPGCEHSNKESCSKSKSDSDSDSSDSDNDEVTTLRPVHVEEHVELDLPKEMSVSTRLCTPDTTSAHRDNKEGEEAAASHDNSAADGQGGACSGGRGGETEQKHDSAFADDTQKHSAIQPMGEVRDNESNDKTNDSNDHKSNKHHNQNNQNNHNKVNENHENHEDNDHDKDNVHDKDNDHSDHNIDNKDHNVHENDKHNNDDHEENENLEDNENHEDSDHNEDNEDSEGNQVSKPTKPARTKRRNLVKSPPRTRSFSTPVAQKTQRLSAGNARQRFAAQYALKGSWEGAAATATASPTVNNKGNKGQGGGAKPKNDSVTSVKGKPKKVAPVITTVGNCKRKAGADAETTSTRASKRRK
ncbi:hypothetical protein PQX77_002340 [Marasmius sp. AFHP31]|nr:hypothetical protein PQX77_002340 [Marasmius sp. AFHP31]